MPGGEGMELRAGHRRTGTVMGGLAPTRMLTSETFAISHSTRASMPRARIGVASLAVIISGGVEPRRRPRVR